jgi:hypothetical protein
MDRRRLENKRVIPKETSAASIRGRVRTMMHAIPREMIAVRAKPVTVLDAFLMNLTNDLSC